MEKTVDIGRNDRCFCGSGKKYKKCCLQRSSPHVIFENTHYIVGMEGFDQISVPDDRAEAFLCYEILTNVFEDWDEKSISIENLHTLIKRYPQISDLWALLSIGYYGSGMQSRAKKILRKSHVRFPKNLTIKLLCYLEGIEDPPHILSFDLKTATQIFIWGCIRLRRARVLDNFDLATGLMEEILENAKRCQQVVHWAVGEALYEMELFEESKEELGLCSKSLFEPHAVLDYFLSMIYSDGNDEYLRGILEETLFEEVPIADRMEALLELKK